MAIREIVFTNGNGDSVTFNEDTYCIYSIEGLGGVQTRVQEQQAPYQDGTTYIDNRLSPRTITISGGIKNPCDLETINANRRELCRVLTPLAGPGELAITLPGPGGVNYNYVIYQATPRDAPVLANKPYIEPFQRFMVTFYCYDPFLYDITEQELSLVYYGAGFYVGSSGVDLFYVPSGGTYFGLLSTINGQSGNLTNSGDVPTPVQIRFNGPATNPKVLLAETGEYVQMTMTLANGDYIDIDTAFGVKSVMFYDASAGTYTAANQYLNLASTFFQCPVGGGTLTFSDSGSASGSSAVIHWTWRYLGN